MGDRAGVSSAAPKSSCDRPSANAPVDRTLKLRADGVVEQRCGAGFGTMRLIRRVRLRGLIGVAPSAGANRSCLDRPLAREQVGQQGSSRRRASPRRSSSCSSSTHSTHLLAGHVANDS